MSETNWSSQNTFFLEIKKHWFFYIKLWKNHIWICISNFMIFASPNFTEVETFEWPWFCHHREHFLLIIISEVGQTYQQNGCKLRAEVFLSATIFSKHFYMVSKLVRYKNTRVVFNFRSSFHKVVRSSKHRVQSILRIKTCKVLVSWVVKQIF